MSHDRSSESSDNNRRVFAYRLWVDFNDPRPGFDSVNEPGSDQVAGETDERDERARADEADVAKRNRQARNARLSHDCRNELQRMLIRIELIKLNVESNPIALDDLEKIRVSCRNLFAGLSMRWN